MAQMRILKYNVVSSTMDKAKELLRNNYKNCIIIAEHQTAGKGKRGRSWYSEFGKSLLFSVVFDSNSIKIPKDFYDIATEKIAKVIYSLYKIKAEVKKPNDIYVKGKKLAGVLVENIYSGNSLKATILGVGINLYPFENLKNEDLKGKITCIKEHFKGEIDKWELLFEIIKYLAEDLHIPSVFFGNIHSNIKSKNIKN